MGRARGADRNQNVLDGMEIRIGERRGWSSRRRNGTRDEAVLSVAGRCERGGARERKRWKGIRQRGDFSLRPSE